MLGRGRTDLYGPVRTGMTRVCTTRPLVMFWDCAKFGPSCAKLGRDQNVSWRLCAYLGLISMIWSCEIKRASREDALWITWKQATNGSSLGDDWPLWSKTGWLLLFTRSGLSSSSIRDREEDLIHCEAMESWQGHHLSLEETGDLKALKLKAMADRELPEDPLSLVSCFPHAIASH
ncbi:hypothetical protein YC2023_018444 [Brassica napus]